VISDVNTNELCPGFVLVNNTTVWLVVSVEDNHERSLTARKVVWLGVKNLDDTRVTISDSRRNLILVGYFVMKWEEGC
jgi:hypothetical protein